MFRKCRFLRKTNPWLSYTDDLEIFHWKVCWVTSVEQIEPFLWEDVEERGNEATGRPCRCEGLSISHGGAAGEGGSVGWKELSPPFSRASVFAVSHGKRAHFQAVSLLNGSSGLHPSFQFPRLIQVVQPTSHEITFPAHAHRRTWF